MKVLTIPVIVVFAAVVVASAQSGRTAGGGYSESRPTRISSRAASVPEEKTEAGSATATEDDVVRVPTDLVTIPVRIMSEDGRPIGNLREEQFKIFENGVEQRIAYFFDEEKPFTVVLALDMSYSSVFKLEDIQLAARIFISKLREDDRVMIVAFDEKPRVLCQATTDRRALLMAIDATKIASGTALYDTLDMVSRNKLLDVRGRKAIVLLSDGVDTASALANARTIERHFAEEDALVYPIRYDTFEDVQKTRRKDAEVRYDEDDRPYIVKLPPQKGERAQDYKNARKFLNTIATSTGGRVYDVSSTTNLNDAFANIATELRKIYSIGYYPAEDRKSGAVYDIKVRVYRPHLKIIARNQILGK